MDCASRGDDLVIEVRGQPAVVLNDAELTKGRCGRLLGSTLTDGSLAIVAKLLWWIAEDAAASPNARIAAAAALRSGADEESVAMLEDLATGTASPEVRAVLRAAPEDDATFEITVREALGRSA